MQIPTIEITRIHEEWTVYPFGVQTYFSSLTPNIFALCNQVSAIYSIVFGFHRMTDQARPDLASW